MKIHAFFFTLSVLLPNLPCAAQSALLELKGIDRAGTLTWTNRVCAPEAIYTVQRAPSPAGPWTSIAEVTNASSISVSNALRAAAGAGFYQVVWLGGAPLVMDYVFTEGSGFTSVTGRLNLTLYYDDATTGMGSWRFQRTSLSVSTRHPVGTGARMEGGYSRGDVGGGADGWDMAVLFYLRGTDEEAGTVVLEGTLYRGQVAGQCVFTRMAGTIYEYISHNTWESIGTFTATRAP